MAICSRCGPDAVSSAGEAGLCPACLLRLGLDTAEDDDAFDLADGLRVLAPIGRGPGATVYLAKATRGDRRFVTIKLFEAPVHVSRFTARVRDLITRIETCEAAPNLTVLDAGILEPSRGYVVARYVSGMPIDAYVKGPARRRADALPLLARVCRLISQLHAAGIVHGAIKAPNIIVSADPEGAEPMLLDAGLRNAFESSLAGFGSPPHTPRVRAPDRRSDLAGLRALAADLVADRHPAESASELIQALARREFETASELAEEAAALASRASRTVW